MTRNRILLTGFLALIALTVFLVFTSRDDAPAEALDQPAAAALEPSGPAKPLPVARKAAEPTERAAADAVHELRVLVLDQANETPLADVPLSLSQGAAGSPTELKSDAQGQAIFADLSPGDYTVKPGPLGDLDYRAEALPVSIEDSASAEIVLRVERRWFLAGTTVEAGSLKPVAGVGLMSGGSGGRLRGVGRSGQDGHFRSQKSYAAGALALYLSQAETECLTRAAGDGPELLQVLVGEGDLTHLLVELEWIGKLRGIVLDSADHPIEGAQVRVMTSDSIYLGNAGLRFWALYTNSDREGGTTLSDEQGQFSFTRLPNDRKLVVVAGAAGFASGRSPELSPPFISGDARVRLRLSEGGSIAGTIHNVSGKPLPKVVITALSKDTDYQADPTRSDENGVFLLSGLKPGVTEVSAKADSSGGGRPTIASGEVAVLAGEQARLNLVAGTDGVHISGLAVDQYGETVSAERAQLSLRTTPREPLAGEQSWGSDSPLQPDGSFNVTVPRKGIYRLTLLGGMAGDRWESQEIQAPAADVRLTFSIVPTSLLTVNILDATSLEPLQRGNISIAWDRGSLGGNFSGGLHKTQIREGSYTLSADVKGYAPLAQELDLSKHLEPETLVELRLDRGRPLSGVVRDAEGQPVKGSTIVLRVGGMLQTANLVYSGGDGRFTLDAVPLEGGSVCVIDEGYRTLASVPIGTGDALLILGENQ